MKTMTGMPAPGTTALGEGLIGMRSRYSYCVALFATTAMHPGTFVADRQIPRHAGTIIGSVRGTIAARAASTGTIGTRRSILRCLISNGNTLAIDIQRKIGSVNCVIRTTITSHESGLFANTSMEIDRKTPDDGMNNVQTRPTVIQTATKTSEGTRSARAEMSVTGIIEENTKRIADPSAHVTAL